MEDKPRASYDYIVIQAEDPLFLEKQINKYKDEIGFYIYHVCACPPKGVMAILCIANKAELAKRTAALRVGKYVAMKEQDVKDLIDTCQYVDAARARDCIENFITWLYEQNANVFEVKE